MALANTEPLQRRALAIIHDPVIRSQGGRKLHQVLGWNDPDAVDYHRLLREFDVIPLVNSGKVDERPSRIVVYWPPLIQAMETGGCPTVRAGQNRISWSSTTKTLPGPR